MAPKTTAGAIAAGHPQTAEAGLEMFQQGGNAFDAAAAAMLASFVTEATLTSAGGGGFLLAHTQDHQNILFDFFAQTPIQKRPVAELDFYPVLIHFGDAVQEFHIGLGSMAVPGNIAGVFHVHRRLGRLPFTIVAEPAIRYARTGVTLSSFQAYCLQLLKPILLIPSGLQSVYAPAGKLGQPGDRVVMPALADTLAYLAATGPEEFYQGAIAHQLVQDCQQQGGHLTLADLAQYRVIERQPLPLTYRGRTLITNPLPSSGGALIAFALELLGQVNLAQMGFGTAAHLHTLALAMRLTNGARRDRYDANLYQPGFEQEFLSAAHLADYQQQLAGQVNKWGSTTHISVIDGEGNAASLTTSNGEGSGYVIPGTGVMVNNMLGEEDLNPGGFHRWQPDRRISSMMAPTIVLQDNRPELVLGSGGSNRIRTAILQVICNVLDFGMEIEAAVRSPRIHWENGQFNLEPGFDPTVLNTLQHHSNDALTLWQQQNMFFGGVHAVQHTVTGLQGTGDDRRCGVVAMTA